ncbi:hypothetical protein [Salinirubrum litoreum]|uniref:Uncharacterized protein n=1 Tax=Salinirubrum litoreum TaxID=1126234 RepID=A0ABD5RBA8_9EURY|nr:hypothetical protein [Salinirubrum litoreum]
MIDPSVASNSVMTTTVWLRTSCISERSSSTFVDSGAWSVGGTTAETGN